MTELKMPFHRYAELCRRQGFDRLCFILSFDCDTPLDVAAADRLDPQLRSLGIRTSYAVPGSQLIQGDATYRRLAEAGAAFINHGYRPHAEWRETRYWAVTDYAALSEDDVVADIRRGHETVCDVIGRPPLGFRAPHFGSYQSPAQREVIYRTVRPLGYRFCSGTLPDDALAAGPILWSGGMAEFPLTGSLREPRTILDSWNYLINRETYVLSEDYELLFRETVDFFAANDLPGLINWYVDPAHVVDQPPFHRAIRYLLDAGAVSLSFEDALALAAPPPAV